MPLALPQLEPSPLTLMLKPVGGACNLRCDYCYYLPVVDDVYAGRVCRMTDETLESVFAGYLPHANDTVTVVWQGGEPTLAGLDFFQRALELQQRHARPGQTVGHCLQTNGTRLDDAWCAFFKAHQFLVGISIDGPPAYHNHYRYDAQQRPSHDDALRGLHLLRKHRVEHNVLTVLNDRNAREPRAVYDYLLSLGQDWLQFIPAIEWENEPTPEHPDRVPTLAPFSPTGEQYGEFLCAVFDRWFARHRDRVHVRTFENVLLRLVTGQTAECTYAEACHAQLTVEHNGDVFGCDHYVEPRWRLGRLGDSPDAADSAAMFRFEDGRFVAITDHPDQGVDDAWFARIDAERLTDFARRKGDLHEQCTRCDYRPLCNGGCPKHKPGRGDRTALSELCAGYRRFYDHTLDRFQWLADHHRRGVLPPTNDPFRKPRPNTRSGKRRGPATRRKRRR